MTGIDAWPLPWSPDDVPHALLDIVRGCNITCRACYNTLDPQIKPLAQIEAELDALLARRRLHSVSIVGGEVTLHPGLCDVVRAIRRRRLFVEVFTNAVLLDKPLVAHLKEAGANVIFAHIERSQKRGDLPGEASVDELRRLWSEKTALIAGCGLDAGLTMTVRRESMPELEEMIRFAIESPHVRYVLVTLNRDVRAIKVFHGDIGSGMTGERAGERSADADGSLSIGEMHGMMRELFGFRPFAALGSNKDPADLRWLSYMIGKAAMPGGGATLHAFKASRSEPAFLRLHRRLAGRYPFYLPHRPGMFRLQTLINALTGGDRAGALAFLRASLRRGVDAHAKRILFQNPAMLAETGEIIHCRTCPDAVMREGHLIPACIGDRWAP